MLNARRSYLAFAGFDVDAIDPYTRFATLLRVQDGKAGAREVFGALADKGKALSIKLVHILQFDDAQRLDKLNAFIAANADFAPAYFLLAQEFSEDRLGAQSLADKRSEAKALTKFVSYEKDGGLLKYFVDQTQLADWLDRSRSRLAALGDVLDPSRFAPTLTPMRSNQGWIDDHLAARAGDRHLLAHGRQRSVHRHRLPGAERPDAPASRCPIRASSCPTAPRPASSRSNISISGAARPARSTSASIRRQRSSKATSRSSTSSGRRGSPSTPAAITGWSISRRCCRYRCAIKQVHYSLNGAALDKEIKMPPCDKKDPYAIPYDYQPYFKVADSVKSMSVQVTYTDGTKSPVREYKRQ